MHRRVDSQRQADLPAQVTALHALQQEQEWLTKLPTWRRRPETVRGLAAAILLPVVLWLINRLLESWFRF